MSHWEEILREVLNKDTAKLKPSIASRKNMRETKKKKMRVGALERFENYYLGEPHAGVYFTRREAECIYHLAQGKTMRMTANDLQLSVRTVEFYVKNMKLKVGVRTKNQLIDKVIKLNFLSSLDSVVLDSKLAN